MENEKGLMKPRDAYGPLMGYVLLLFFGKKFFMIFCKFFGDFDIVGLLRHYPNAFFPYQKNSSYYDHESSGLVFYATNGCDTTALLILPGLAVGDYTSAEYLLVLALLLLQQLLLLL